MKEILFKSPKILGRRIEIIKDIPEPPEGVYWDARDGIWVDQWFGWEDKRKDNSRLSIRLAKEAK